MADEQATKTIDKEQILDALREVYDPEIPVNIVDLGLVYDITIDSGKVDVKMTLTALGCPMAGEVVGSVSDEVMKVEGVKDVNVELTFDPPWTTDRMSENARWELGMA